MLFSLNCLSTSVITHSVALLFLLVCWFGYKAQKFPAAQKNIYKNKNLTFSLYPKIFTNMDLLSAIQYLASCFTITELVLKWVMSQMNTLSILINTALYSDWCFCIYPDNKSSAVLWCSNHVSDTDCYQITIGHSSQSQNRAASQAF